jgi:hypothetical protein
VLFDPSPVKSCYYRIPMVDDSVHNLKLLRSNKKYNTKKCTYAGNNIDIFMTSCWLTLIQSPTDKYLQSHEHSSFKQQTTLSIVININQSIIYSCITRNQVLEVYLVSYSHSCSLGPVQVASTINNQQSSH